MHERVPSAGSSASLRVKPRERGCSASGCAAAWPLAANGSAAFKRLVRAGHQVPALGLRAAPAAV